MLSRFQQCMMWWIWHDPEMIIGACHFSCMWSTRPKKGELSLHQEAANYFPVHHQFIHPGSLAQIIAHIRIFFSPILVLAFRLSLTIAFLNTQLRKKAICQVFLTRSLGARWARLICHSPGPPDPLNPRTLDPSDPEPTGPWTHRTLNPPDPGPPTPDASFYSAIKIDKKNSSTGR